jgi:hypothetical protein
MLTASTRELFLLQSKSNLKQIQKNVDAAQDKKKLTTVASESMVYVDADAEKARMLDPCTAFNIPAYVAAKQTQLHLGGKGINAIHPNTMLFVSLETMILSDNRLTKLTGLLPTAAPNVTTAPTGCSRLKQLVLTNNRLSSLKGDIEGLKYLEVLLLGNNLLSNMERVSRQLQHLHYLTQLDLTKNPVCEEQSYRLYFIHKHPSLEQLDRRSITMEERSEAEALYGRRSHSKGKLTHGGMSSSSSVVSSMFPAIHPKSSGASEGAGGGGGGDDKKVVASSFAFGGSFKKHNADSGETRHADGMSGSAALLESKVRAILLKRHADDVREQSKAQSQLDEIVERRQMFHTLWEWSGHFLRDNGQAAADTPPQETAVAPTKAKGGGKGAAAPATVAPVATSHERHISVPQQLRQSSIATTHPHQSALFTEGCGGKFPALEPLLERVRQLLRSEPERKSAVAEELRKHLHEMIPERPGDEFHVSYTKWQQERLPDAVQQYLRRTSADLLTSGEVAALARLFGGTDIHSVDAESWDAVVNALDGCETLSAAQLKAAFRAEYKLPSLASAGTRRASIRPPKGPSASATFAITVDQATQLLVRYLPFVALRPQYFQAKSALALKESQPELAKKYFQLMNEATEHHRFMVQCLGPGEDASAVFVAVTRMPR